jgi:lyso-ornithine lipid O-acyltransferase
MSKARAAVRLAGFILLTVPLMPVQQVFKWTWPAMARRFPHHFHRLLSRVLGFHVERRGVIPNNGPALLVCNHVSWIDIVALSAAAPVSFIAKREVGGWPLFGQLARLQRTVFVDRDKRHKTGEHRNEMTDRLKSGDMLILFPEGTSHDGNRVLPFKSAFFGAAELEGVPVIPVTLAYTRVNGLPMTRRHRPFFAWYGDMDLPPHLWEALKTGPIRVVVQFHEALDIKALGGRKGLAKQAETVVAEGLSHLLHGRSEIG